MMMFKKFLEKLTSSSPSSSSTTPTSTSRSSHNLNADSSQADTQHHQANQPRNLSSNNNNSHHNVNTLDPTRSTTATNPLNSRSHSNMRDMDSIECYYADVNHHRAGPVSFNSAGDEHETSRSHHRVHYDTSCSTSHATNANRNVADCRMGSSNSFHHEDENNRHHDDHHEYMSRQGSSQSSLSANFNKV
jgi:hypothetical protein